jgi:predicted short-subunit dehydrogenase-like oxidoreductase (DUF2520 family)
MKIGIIGAGKVGFTLGKFLSQSDNRIIGYYSRDPEHAQEAAAFTTSKSYRDPKELIFESDAIFLTVPDQAIQAVYQQIRQFEIQDKYICHCSGALSSADAFPGIADTGAFGISIHPLFPISDKFTAYRELSGAFFCLEGDEKAVSVFGPILEQLGGKVQRISPEAKARYHAGCVMASNLVCGLAQMSIETLATCGFTAATAQQALAPLLRSNMAHLLESDPITALTGPVERGDTETLKKHLTQLYNPQTRAIYCLLSQKLAEMAQRKHPDLEISSMTEVLQGGFKDDEKHSIHISENEAGRNAHLGDYLL